MKILLTLAEFRNEAEKQKERKEERGRGGGGEKKINNNKRTTTAATTSAATSTRCTNSTNRLHSPNNQHSVAVYTALKKQLR